MKKSATNYFNGILLIGILISSLFACSEDNTPDVKSGELNVQVVLPKEYQSNENKDLLQGLDVTITNLSNNKITTIKTDENGIAIFKSLPISNYDISTSTTIAKDKYQEITGYKSEEDVTFTGTLSGYTLNPNTTNNISITINSGSNKHGFVLKTIYYAGSDYREAVS